MKENSNKMIYRSSSSMFSDGTQMRQYWGRNRDKIYKMITEEGNPFIVQYKDQCEVLINKYIEYQETRENNKKIWFTLFWLE